MFRLYFNRGILVGLILALTILSWLAISSYLTIKHLIKGSHMVARTLDILYHTERVLVISSSIEIGQRGYSLTGNEAFLEPYTKANNEIDSHLQNLQTLTRDNPRQKKRVQALEETIRALMQFSFQAIEKRKENFQTSLQINASMEGKRLMDSIRDQVATIHDEENASLKARNQANQNQIEKFNYAFISLLAVTGIILITIFLSINFNLKVRAEAEKKLQAAFAEIKDLYDNAPCGYHSIDAHETFVEINTTLAAWLGYKKEELINKKKITDIISEKERLIFQDNFKQFMKTGYIHNLEFDFVKKDGTEFPVVLNSVAIMDNEGTYTKSRSTVFDNTDRRLAEMKIKNLNKELEGFTYSVSHDLRAPLRSIDGYSKILQEDYSDKLDDEGKRVIQVIMSNAKRMGKLVDDLLELVRLGRKEVLPSQVNMTQLVNGVAQELLAQQNRKIDIKITPLEPSYGDLDMMRQVWENLLSNAIKYTGKTANPTIEVSSFETTHEVGYRVKDNGVGFDMQYMPKLFGVFQRLHKMQDFTGTGVGLAIVKRVIDRHNGRVWAEGKINEGATFYFTIPNSNGKQ